MRVSYLSILIRMAHLIYYNNGIVGLYDVNGTGGWLWKWSCAGYVCLRLPKKAAACCWIDLEAT